MSIFPRHFDGVNELLPEHESIDLLSFNQNDESRSKIRKLWRKNNKSTAKRCRKKNRSLHLHKKYFNAWKKRRKFFYVRSMCSRVTASVVWKSRWRSKQNENKVNRRKRIFANDFSRVIFIFDCVFDRYKTKQQRKSKNWRKMFGNLSLCVWPSRRHRFVGRNFNWISSLRSSTRKNCRIIQTSTSEEKTNIKSIVIRCLNLKLVKMFLVNCFNWFLDA